MSAVASMRWSLLDKSARGRGAFNLPWAPAEAMAALARHAQLAERLGYHRIWFPEHHVQNSTGPCPGYAVVQAGLATRAIRVGTGCVLPAYRKPVQVAELGAFLASLFPGRVDLGLGIGPGVPESARPLFGFTPDKAARDDAFARAAREALAILGGEVPEAAEVLGGWTQRPRAWVIGLGPAKAALAAGHAGFAAGWISPSPGDAERLAASIGAHAEACRAAGTEPESILVVDVSSPFPGLREVVVRSPPAGDVSVSIHGDPDRARDHLASLAALAGASEVMVTTGGLAGPVGCALWEWLAPRETARQGEPAGVPAPASVAVAA